MTQKARLELLAEFCAEQESIVVEKAREEERKRT